MRALLRVLGFLKKYWLWVIVTYVCLLAGVGFQTAVPQVLRMVIDTGIAKGEQGFLILAGVAVLAVSALRGAFAYGQTYLGEFLSQKVAYDLRNAIYDRLQRLSYAYHDKQQTGQLMSRATADVEAVRGFVSMASLRMVYNIVLFSVVLYLLLSMNWKLALVSFLCFPFIFYRAVLVGRRLRPIWMTIQQGIAALGTILQENLSGVRVVKAFSLEGRESAKFRDKATELYERNLETTRQNAFNMPLMTFLTTVCTGLILWYGGREVLGGNLTVGELVAFNSYLPMLDMPVRMLANMVNQISRSMAAGERIFEVLDTESAVKEAPNAIELPRVKGLVRFEGVSFGYDAVSSVLKNISLEAQPGQLVALLGATGSGKSTVVNLIPRFYDVTGGRITIDGIDIRDVTLSSLRRNIGIVQQDIFLFTASIRDNIAYGEVEASEEDIITAAKVAQIHDFIESLPDGYDTLVGERGVTLSGGQKQRVAIARTLLLDPPILMFDDSTSSVDTETEYLIQQALRELMKGRTTFVIAQRLRTVRNADQILVLKDGEVAERGTHAELLEKGGIYREIYDLQLRDQEEALEKVMAFKEPHDRDNS